MLAQGTVNIEIICICFIVFLLFALIAKGLSPLFISPEKIYSSFNEKCRQERRGKRLVFDQSYENDKRKSTSIFPRYLPLRELKKEYRRHTIGYCFCHALCIITVVEIFQKLLQK